MQINRASQFIYFFVNCVAFYFLLLCLFEKLLILDNFVFTVQHYDKLLMKKLIQESVHSVVSCRIRSFILRILTVQHMQHTK